MSYVVQPDNMADHEGSHPTAPSDGLEFRPSGKVMVVGQNKPGARLSYRLVDGHCNHQVRPQQKHKSKVKPGGHLVDPDPGMLQEFICVYRRVCPQGILLGTSFIDHKIPAWNWKPEPRSFSSIFA